MGGSPSLSLSLSILFPSHRQRRNILPRLPITETRGACFTSSFGYIYTQRTCAFPRHCALAILYFISPALYSIFIYISCMSSLSLHCLPFTRSLARSRLYTVFFLSLPVNQTAACSASKREATLRSFIRDARRFVEPRPADS